MLNKFFYCISSSYDPWYNLSLEEYMVTNLKQGGVILYIYQNENSVVIGKNQNPWLECQTELLKNDNVKLARRISGGGAVFHDLGNLNFCIIVDREYYDFKRQLQVILDSVNDLKIKARFSGRSDILVDEKKFSGNAFCYKKTTCFHHGTILISANLENLNKYLAATKEKIESKGIKSIRSTVCNLTDFNKNINIEMVIQALKTNFEKLYGITADYKLTVDVEKEVAKLYLKHSCWDWLYAQSPRFNIQFSSRFMLGDVDFYLSLKDARIQETLITSNFIDRDLIIRLQSALTNVQFNSKKLSQAVLGITCDWEQKSIIKDISNFLLSKSF